MAAVAPCPSWTPLRGEPQCGLRLVAGWIEYHPFVWGDGIFTGSDGSLYRLDGRCWYSDAAAAASDFAESG